MSGCKYCDGEKKHYAFNRSRMCQDCRDEYDTGLEDRADAERDERLIETKRRKQKEDG